MVQVAVRPFREISVDGKLRINLHPGQTRVHKSKARYVAMLAGSQSGKTVYGSHWLDREIRERGPGDYLIGTSSFPLLTRKLLPEFLYVFQELFHYGVYNGSEKIFTFHKKETVKHDYDYVLFPDSAVPTRVLIGSAQNPESMESATVKGVWLDECVAPETLIETEIGQLPISEIVGKRLNLRVWSYDTESEDWQLKPVVRWIKLPQRKPLLRLGNLRLTDNHKAWTKEGYIIADELIASAKSAILKAEVVKNVKTKGIPPFRGNQAENERIRKESSARSQFENINQLTETLPGTSRTQTTNIRTTEKEICQSDESALGSTWGRTFNSSDFREATGIGANQEKQDLGTWRQRQTEKLASGETGGCSRMGERIRSDYGQRLATPRIQDRCGGTRIESGYRSRECSQPSQNRVVQTEWLDVSSLLKSDGGSLDGGCSSDGFVYNLEVEGNHNYLADNILVSNCGMHMFKRETWEAIQRRTLIEKARILMTTTLYGLGWLKTDIYDPWEKGDPDIDVIQFESIENPAFPLSEYQRMKASMPDWKFDLFHRGRFSKPAGLIYNAFDTARDVIEPFEIPNHWPRYVGHDFGPVHTVALWIAQDPASGLFYVYRDYAMGGLSTFEHVTNWKELSKNERIASCLGGSATEDGWRGDFTRAGWRIDKPLDGAVESGIMRVYGYEKLGKKRVFRTCQNYIAEKQTYSRELDDMYNQTEKIENKEIFHFMDAERALFTLFRPLSVSNANTETAPVGRRV